MNIAEMLEKFDWIIALAVFLAYLFIDGLFALYMFAVVRQRAAASATIGAGMHFLFAFGIISYTQNYLYVLPVAMGSWLGTFVIVSWDRKRHPKASKENRSE